MLVKELTIQFILYLLNMKVKITFHSYKKKFKIPDVYTRLTLNVVHYASQRVFWRFAKAVSTLTHTQALMNLHVCAMALMPRVIRLVHLST